MIKDDLARAFVATHSFKTNPAGFKLASGAMSPYYVDCRVLMAHPEPRALVAQLAMTTLHDVALDCIGGLEIGAIAIATAISDEGYRGQAKHKWRTFVVRKQAKDHGTGKLIDGTIQPHDRALIVDDVLTSGGSVIKAITAARGAGLTVSHALVIVDRQERRPRQSRSARREAAELADDQRPRSRPALIFSFFYTFHPLSSHMNASGGIVEVVFTAHVRGAHSDRAPCMSTENTSAIPLLFLLLAFKFYPPPPLTNLLHPAYILVDPGAALRFSFAQNAIRAAAVLLHHLQRLFSKGGG